MELIRIALLFIAFIGILLLVKISLIAHKDRKQQIKEVIQKIRNRGVMMSEEELKKYKNWRKRDKNRVVIIKRNNEEEKH